MKNESFFPFQLYFFLAKHSLQYFIYNLAQIATDVNINMQSLLKLHHIIQL